MGTFVNHITYIINIVRKTKAEMPLSMDHKKHENENENKNKNKKIFKCMAY